MVTGWKCYRFLWGKKNKCDVIIALAESKKQTNKKKTPNFETIPLSKSPSKQFAWFREFFETLGCSRRIDVCLGVDGKGRCRAKRNVDAWEVEEIRR